MKYVFEPSPPVTLPIAGSEQRFPVHRVYCVGKNYADHIREMGSDPSREEPCFFLKPADAVVSGAEVTYPPATANYHYEGELVLALREGGKNVDPEAADELIFGYAAGLDMTRRDLQVAAGRIGMPWDTGKAFDQSAPLGPLVPREACGALETGSMRLWVNDTLKQDADLGQMIWKPREIISQLSRLYTLQAGDLIFTGTPAGVGAVKRGDRIRLAIAGLEELHVSIV